MKIIKIIDLLNKIANGGEVPIKIQYDDEIYEFKNNDYERTTPDGNIYTLFYDLEYIYKINDVVKILDEEAEFENIEELSLKDLAISINETYNDNVDVLMGKINDLIKNQKKIIEKLGDNK